MRRTASAAAALKTPGHKVVNVESAGHVQLAQFVVAPSGQGYLVKSNLPTLSSAQTYQLWGVINGQAISLGLLGQAPNAGRLHLRRIAHALQTWHHGGAGGGFRGADRLHAGSGNGLTAVVC